jgi:hypothetical protein
MVIRKNLTYEQRLGLLHFLLLHYDNDTLEQGALAHGAALMSVTRGAVSRLWKDWVLKHTASLNGEWDVASGKETNHGTIKYFPEELLTHLQNFPCAQKRPFRV